MLLNSRQTDIQTVQTMDDQKIFARGQQRTSQWTLINTDVMLQRNQGGGRLAARGGGRVFLVLVLVLVFPYTRVE